jgi:hypothetical protein
MAVNSQAWPFRSGISRYSLSRCACGMESLLAEQAAQSTMLTFLMGAVAVLEAKEGVERNALLQKWERRGNEVLSSTSFVGVQKANG